jgi:hypothetical protein
MSSAARSEPHCTRPSIARSRTLKPVAEWTPWSTSGSIAPAVQIVLLDEARRRFEFAQTLERLTSMPGAGQRYRVVRGKLIQRVLMKKTGCHVYYLHDRERDLIEIHSIGGARRERGPRL